MTKNQSAAAVEATVAQAVWRDFFGAFMGFAANCVPRRESRQTLWEVTEAVLMGLECIALIGLLREQNSALVERCAQLEEQNARLTARVAELQRRLIRDSGNSSKPCSSDVFGRPTENPKPKVAALLAPYDLAGVVTADAPHIQRAHARHLVQDKQAHHVLTVKKNQPSLYEQLRLQPWGRASAKFYHRTTGHGRLQTRVVEVLHLHEPGHRLPPTPSRPHGSCGTAPTPAQANAPAKRSTPSRT
ncbi:DUF6444 domain-containing protein [Kitasatospora sp. GAS204B]|uniref:DUF6444 domain-containing protein n=2 Tax=Kitasatospora TaxID=2063 RepID=UPI002476F60B|nr:DUF6444 domain-containing protein [Kitasatospora sp. GAS204B]